MAETLVKTVQVIDPRIEPQPDPLYDYVVGPTQNQYYRIPASGLSNSNITFNNLTTLGVDRAYLDTFEIEITAEIQFHLNELVAGAGGTVSMGPLTTAANQSGTAICPAPDEWTFDSFPFNKCCEEARVNINGGAFFSQPLSYLRAKEHYMNQRSLARCYENVCPHVRPLKQNELGKASFFSTDNRVSTNQATSGMGGNSTQNFRPTRLGIGYSGYQTSPQNLEGGFNNSIVRRGNPINAQGAHITPFINGGTEDSYAGYEYMFRTPNYMVYRVKWREPIFCSPFASKYDATYGRPLYNITSMDLSFSLQNLGNMIRVANLYSTIGTNMVVESYNVSITSAALCYQVMTVPAERIEKPLTTIVPYRRFVPYVTDYNGGMAGGAMSSAFDVSGADNAKFKSGVYTLNEIPTAIWLFIGPTKDILQMNYLDGSNQTAGSIGTASTKDNSVKAGNMWVTNKQFGFIKKVNLTLANTTQILNTAQPEDLYRIAKANGCEDSFLDWGVYDAILPKTVSRASPDVPGQNEAIDPTASIMSMGCGSVLRLIPGVDIIIPDQPLIPGANANNMVFQAEIDAYIPPHSAKNNKYALWILFEYVGVAAISPGQCEITMNPLGSGEILAVAPVVSYDDVGENMGEPIEGGSRFGDAFRRFARKAQNVFDKVKGFASNFVKKNPAIVDAVSDKIVSMVPQQYQGLANTALSTGRQLLTGNDSGAAEDGSGVVGGRAAKRRRGTCGGMVIGRGMDQWI